MNEMGFMYVVVIVGEGILSLFFLDQGRYVLIILSASIVKVNEPDPTRFPDGLIEEV